jgi:hypothetical protein
MKLRHAAGGRATWACFGERTAAGRALALRLHRKMLGAGSRRRATLIPALAAALTLALHRVKDTPGADRAPRFRTG